MSDQTKTALTGLCDIFVGITAEGVEESAASSVGYGLTLAKTAGAHLTIQSAAWHWSSDRAWLGSFDDGFVAAEDRRLDRLAQAAAERAAGESAQAGVVCATETPRLAYPAIVERLVAHARLYDLTVLDAAPLSYASDRERIEQVLFGSGRPVIVVPPGRDAFSARRIVVAWDGSAPAARAINDALPFLRAAEAVEIACVVAKRELADHVAGAEIAPHLVRHGVAVTVNDLPPQGTIADTLLLAAGLFRADLLVVGAYGHSRLREQLFGGVTQSLLREASLPLLLSH